LHGITADYLPYLQSIPDLVQTLPDSFDPDETAAVHQTLFGFNIFPNASIFLDPSRLLGGSIANQHAEVYRQGQFMPESAVDQDHISQSLAFLAHLSNLEANLNAGSQPPILPQSYQFKFLENHLLPWLLPFSIAVELQNIPFYKTLARLTRFLAVEHYSSAKLLHLNIVNQGTTQQELNSRPPSLQDGRTGLRQIARFLVTPVLSGFYIGRSDINQLARRLNLPHGFGSRDQMLQTLIESAGQYDGIPQLFASFHALVATWHQAYQEIIQEHPDLTAHILPWHFRLQQTSSLLSQMEKEASK
jgi:TorA maturation chaperone TorD